MTENKNNSFCKARENDEKFVVNIQSDTNSTERLETHFREVRDIAKTQILLTEAQKTLIESQHTMTAELKTINMNLQYIGDGMNAGFQFAKSLLRLFGKVIIGGVIVIIVMAIMILYITNINISTNGGLSITHGTSNH